MDGSEAFVYKRILPRGWKTDFNELSHACAQFYGRRWAGAGGGGLAVANGSGEGTTCVQPVTCVLVALTLRISECCALVAGAWRITMVVLVG